MWIKKIPHWQLPELDRNEQFELWGETWNGERGCLGNYKTEAKAKKSKAEIERYIKLMDDCQKPS